MAISFVAVASNIAYINPGVFVVNKPTGTVAGDTMITFLTNFDGNIVGQPSGWTQILPLVDNTAATLRSYMFYKLAGASEPSTYTWTLDGSADLAAGVVVHTYRGVDLASPIGNVITAQSTTLETLASGNVNVTVAGSWLFGMSSCRHTGTASCTCTAASMTERADGFAADTVSSFTRATATYDSNGTVATGNQTRTYVRTGTTAAHNVTLVALQPEADTPIAGSDTGSGAEAHSLAVTQTRTDTGSGLEGTPKIATTRTDTGSGLDAHTLAVSFTKTETGSGIDSGSISAALSGAETGSGLSAQTLAASLAGGDTGGGADSGSVFGGTTPQGADTGSFTETFIGFASFTGADTGLFTEGQSVAVPPVPLVPGLFGDTLVMGPAALYIGAVGAVEPAVTAVGSAPDPLVWTDLGGVLGGVELAITQEYQSVIFQQIPETPFNRLQKRHLEIKTPLAETTLANLGLALNDTAGVTGTAYTPTVYDSATQLTYRSLIVDGWAPGVTAFGRHKRRRIVVRKCLSIDNIELAYTKDGQTVYNVTWSCHYVDGSTAPFRVIDQV